MKCILAALFGLAAAQFSGFGQNQGANSQQFGGSSLSQFGGGQNNLGQGVYPQNGQNSGGFGGQQGFQGQQQNAGFGQQNNGFGQQQNSGSGQNGERKEPDFVSGLSETAKQALRSIWNNQSTSEEEKRAKTQTWATKYGVTLPSFGGQTGQSGFGQNGFNQQNGFGQNGPNGGFNRPTTASPFGQFGNGQNNQFGGQNGQFGGQNSFGQNSFGQSSSNNQNTGFGGQQNQGIFSGYQYNRV